MEDTLRLNIPRRHRLLEVVVAAQVQNQSLEVHLLNRNLLAELPIVGGFLRKDGLRCWSL